MTDRATGFSWVGRSALVTGGTGFLGSWLSLFLCDRGARVVAAARRPPLEDSGFARLGLRDRVEVLPVDVERFSDVQRVLDAVVPDVLFHLAALTPPVARREPRLAFEANARGTLNVLEAIRLTGRRIPAVVASTYEVYGDHGGAPYVEDAPLRASLPYGVSKVGAELATTLYHRAYGMPVAIARSASFYGGADANFDRLVPGTIRAVARGERPIIRSDGRMIRDWVYVEDAVLAHVMMAEALDQQRAAGEAFNISTERPTSVLEVTDVILKAMDRPDLVPDVRGQASGETPVMYASAAKAKTELGWSPQQTLEDGLRMTVAWYREHGIDAGRI